MISTWDCMQAGDVTPHLSSQCTQRFRHISVHLCKLLEVLPGLAATTATICVQHSWSCDPILALQDLWAGGVPEHGAASGDCAMQLVLLGNTTFSGSPVISPAVIGMYIMACHASLYMLAETAAERFVQTNGLSFLLHKKKNSGKKEECLWQKICALWRGGEQIQPLRRSAQSSGSPSVCYVAHPAGT